MAGPRATAKEYFTPLTGVRAVMMYGVFNCHFNLVYPEVFGDGLYRFARELHIGVPVFYVLSGFLIHYRYAAGLALRDPGWLGQYLQNRLARIYPVYFLVLFLTYLAQGFPDPRTTWVTFTLTQSFFPDLVKAGIGQAWTLTIEETFYLLAPLLFWLTARGTALLPCLLMWGLGVALGGVPGSPYAGQLGFVLGRTLCGAIGCFAAGIALARVVRFEESLSSRRSSEGFPRWTYGGLAASVVLLVGISRLGHLVDPTLIEGKVARGADHPLGALAIFTVFPLAVAATLYGLIREPSGLARLLGSRLFVLLGRSSYCFYLIHLGVIQQWLDRYLIFPWTSNNAVRIVALFGLVNLLAVALFKIVEHPANEYFKSLGRSTGGEPQAEPATTAAPEVLSGGPIFPTSDKAVPPTPGLIPLGPTAPAWPAVGAALVCFLAWVLPAALRMLDRPAAYGRLLAEDGLYETLQPLVCLAAAWLWFDLGRLERRQPALPRIRRWGRWCLALAFVAMLGEEISWGQRLLGGGSSLAWREVNFQGEWNLHNLRWFQTAEVGNRLQNLWLALVWCWLGVMPLVAAAAPRLAAALAGRGWPLASWPLAAAVWGSLVVYRVSEASSEVLELQLLVCLAAWSLEVYHRLVASGSRLSERLALGWAVLLPPALVALSLQAGEASLPSVRSHELVDQAVNEIQRGKLREARSFLDRSIHEWPQNARAHAILGQLELLEQNWEAAAGALAKAIALEPKDARAHQQLGTAYLALQRWDQAREELHLAARLAPGEPAPQLLLAQVELGRGDLAAAAAIYQELLRQQPVPAAQNALAWLWATSAESTPDERRQALELARQACAATGERDAGYLDTWAAAAAALEDFDQAVRQAERALQQVRAAGDTKRAAAIADRLEGYRQQVPYLTQPATGSDKPSTAPP